MLLFEHSVLLLFPKLVAFSPDVYHARNLAFTSGLYVYTAMECHPSQQELQVKVDKDPLPKLYPNISSTLMYSCIYVCIHNVYTNYHELHPVYLGRDLFRPKQAGVKRMTYDN